MGSSSSTRRSPGSEPSRLSTPTGQSSRSPTARRVSSPRRPTCPGKVGARTLGVEIPSHERLRPCKRSPRRLTRNSVHRDSRRALGLRSAACRDRAWSLATRACRTPTHDEARAPHLVRAGGLLTAVSRARRRGGTVLSRRDPAHCSSEPLVSAPRATAASAAGDDNEVMAGVKAGCVDALGVLYDRYCAGSHGRCVATTATPKKPSRKPSSRSGRPAGTISPSAAKLLQGCCRSRVTARSTSRAATNRTPHTAPATGISRRCPHVSVQAVGRLGRGEQGRDRLAVEVGGDRGGEVLVHAAAL